jgi:hypothetical protein
MEQGCDTRPGWQFVSRSTVLGMIVVVCLLGSILGPATLSSREAARKISCLSNLRMIGLAWINGSVQRGDRGIIPLSQKESWSATDLNSGKDSGSLGWPVQLLPMMDRSNLKRVIEKDAFSGGRRLLERVGNGTDDVPLQLAEFVCPSDVIAKEGRARLSYVANSGFVAREVYNGDPERLHRLGLLSWDDNSVSDEVDDVKIGAATGVLWPETDLNRKQLEQLFGDGTSQTLLFGENGQAGSWFDSEMPLIGFGVPVVSVGVRVTYGSGGYFESSQRPLNSEFAGSGLTTVQPMDWTINCDPNAKIGSRPRPSSLHKEGVSAVFADGSCRFLSERIDKHIYVKMLSHDGVTYGEKSISEIDLMKALGFGIK